MKCPSCGADNSEEAAACGLCNLVFRQRTPPPAASAAPALPPSPLGPARAALAAGDMPAAQRAMAGLLARLSPNSRAGLIKESVARWLEAAGLDPATATICRSTANIAAMALEKAEDANAFRLLQALTGHVEKHPAGDAGVDVMLLLLGLKGAGAPAPRKADASPVPEIAGLGEFKEGQTIGGRYRIEGVLGRGGFGIVYKAFDGAASCAVKTFLDKFLGDAQTRAQFTKEAQTWIALERHPNLVKAQFLFEEHNRMFLDMELVAPGADGVNSLDGRIKKGGYDRAQALRWAVQFCRGIEHAYAKGVRCHLDIKPPNLMLAADGTLKITDFGLAILGKTSEHGAAGTPTHMPPEQWRDAALCDHRADQYAFGVTLYQLFGGGRLPFLPKAGGGAAIAELRALHERAAPPPLEDPLFPVIARCLEKAPESRFKDFPELRARLEEALEALTGETVPELRAEAPSAADLGNRATSLCSLKRYDEALALYDRALAIKDSALLRTNKGVCLEELGRVEEALACYDRAISIQPDGGLPYLNKGGLLGKLGRQDEELACYSKGIAADPGSAALQYNKANVLYELGRLDEAFECADAALKRESRHAMAWKLMGDLLGKRDAFAEAVQAYERALAIDPTRAVAWMAYGQALAQSGKVEKSLGAFDKSLELSPFAGTWSDKGVALEMLGRFAESAACHRKALELDPTLERARRNLELVLRKAAKA
ncbi:MAG: tetratricopeptide repeat protein [Elusimicrobia bacterium]|nr:tetratricopeptide repeat protein [Elusimicrobiota bacterium]